VEVKAITGEDIAIVTAALAHVVVMPILDRAFGPKRRKLPGLKSISKA
jgi:hypothetical protein